LAVEDGQTDFITFTDASGTFGVEVADVDFCGRREYEVQFVSDSFVVSWI
jgi:hypothetical protein